ncbi:unnamed protein product [Merluccius merluccius]
MDRSSLKVTLSRTFLRRLLSLHRVEPDVGIDYFKTKRFSFNGARSGGGGDEAGGETSLERRFFFRTPLE